MLIFSDLGKIGGGKNFYFFLEYLIEGSEKSIGSYYL
jgi:hypothetical protein